MRARLWGTRGSIASAGADTVKYGGDTASVEVRSSSGQLLILDAGSGIRPLGGELKGERRIDIALSHLHMDHVQGLPFFSPLLDPDVEVHIWGPISTTRNLRERLARYLSPPLFPVRVRDLPNVQFHDVLPSTFQVGDLSVTADLITHPGATLGYRLEEDGAVLTYMPDHEPALGNQIFPDAKEWMSGFSLAQNADVLIHDAQYTQEQYESRVGWGHTSYQQLSAFVGMAKPKAVVTFHHDPWHSDETLDKLHSEFSKATEAVEVIPGTDRLTIDI